MNLDGGGSTSLVCRRAAAQPPARATSERPEPGGRPVSTALLFVPRSNRT